MTFSKEVENVLQAYFGGDTSPQVIQAMEAWLREDPDNPRILAEYGLIDRLLAHEQKKLDASAIFAMLLEAEEAAHPAPVALRPEQRADAIRTPTEPISLKQFCSAAGYLAMKGLRTKAGVLSAAAAILLVGVLLFVQLTGPAGTPDPHRLAGQDANPQADPVTAITVATLTAEHDAVWAQQPGEDLHPGQRLTLTQGFAEVTTARGAVVILQAPATIELLDNNNAIRLHAGKLVGIVETESSKGFLVRTPHMDVTDLGTRFGVDASRSSATEVHVLDGVVLAAPRGDATSVGKPQRLTAGQSALALYAGSEITRTQYDPVRFAAILSETGYEPAIPATAIKAGILQIEGDVAWSVLTPGAYKRDELPARDAIQICRELRGHRLDADIVLTLHEPGTYGSFNGIEPATLSAGNTARSYYLFLKPMHGDEQSKLEGRVSFDGEIVGLVQTPTAWQAFRDSVQDSPEPIFEIVSPQQKHGSLLRNSGESISISEDRRTLSFRLQASDGGTGVAQIIRVIVRDSPGGQP